MKCINAVDICYDYISIKSLFKQCIELEKFIIATLSLIHLIYVVWQSDLKFSVWYRFMPISIHYSRATFNILYNKLIFHTKKWFCFTLNPSRRRQWKWRKISRNKTKNVRTFIKNLLMMPSLNVDFCRQHLAINTCTSVQLC